MDAAADSEEDLPALFEESVISLTPPPKTLASRSGWKVVEESLHDGGAMRWMVCEQDYSLDQTRVRLVPRCNDQMDFQRNHLRASSHQIMALVVAYGLRQSFEPKGRAVCILGGGGMALPMALLEQGVRSPIHVVELHEVATWSPRQSLWALILRAFEKAYFLGGH